jgi:hypothetical protein
MALVYLCGFQYQEESTGYSITSGPLQKLEPILALVYIQKSHFKMLEKKELNTENCLMKILTQRFQAAAI